MPRLKTLSGQDVVRVLAEFSFAIEAQRGSHVKLRRLLSDGTRQTLTIPLHNEIDRAAPCERSSVKRFDTFLKINSAHIFILNSRADFIGRLIHRV